MKIAVAQTCPKVGTIEENVGRHVALVRVALRHNASLIVFPELSLTGYEPSLAKSTACEADDQRLAVFQNQCDQHNISVAVGLSLQSKNLPCLATIVFRPTLSPIVYAKRFLHDDEFGFYQPGSSDNCMIFEAPKVALAICYELSCPEHADQAFADGASVYVASVAKNESGCLAAEKRLGDIAKRRGAVVLMSNSVGIQDAVLCSGGSKAWGRSGQMLGQLDSTSEGVLIVDDDREQATAEML